MQVDFERERQWWDARAATEERDRADEAVNRALRWREIERHLAGVHTILEVGGGTGAFSIPLARRGFSVTHVDFSPARLEIARRRADGLANIAFVEGNACDIPQFADRSFDLVLNMDGAISFCGTEAEQAFAESCRLTGKTLIITVSNLACLAPVVVSGSLEVASRLLPAVYAMFERGEWHQEQFPENALLAKGSTQDYVGPLKAFRPAELRALVEHAGMKVLRLGGLGSLTSLCGLEAVQRAQKYETLFQEFLDLCERYDREILPDGPGTRERAGLILVAELVV